MSESLVKKALKEIGSDPFTNRKHLKCYVFGKEEQNDSDNDY